MDIAPDKHERILAAAARLVVRNGLQCSMAAIAEEAGVATGSLYNYFESKEALARGLYDRVAMQMTEALVVPDDLEPDPGQRLRNYFARYVDFIWEDAERAQLFNYLDNAPLISGSDAARIFGPLVAHGRQLVEAAQAEGLVKPGSPGLMISFVRGAVRNMLKHRRYDSTALGAQEREHLTAMCWDAIRI